MNENGEKFIIDSKGEKMIVKTDNKGKFIYI